MRGDTISMRQLLTLTAAALLSPALQALPARSAALAGRGAWLSTVFAIPLFLGLCGLLFALLRGYPAGTGLAEVFGDVLGRRAGQLLTALYLLWGILLLGVNARLCALRFLAGYRNASPGLFLLVLLGFALWMGRGKRAALARAGEMFYLILAPVLAFVLLSALPSVQAKNLLPLWVGDLPGALRATAPALAVLSYAVFGAFLAGGVPRAAGNFPKTLRWAALFCCALTALQLVCLGCLGPMLVTQLDAPFFVMVKGIGAAGAFERVEAVVIALWVLADLALLGLLVFACRAMAEAILPIKEGKHAVLPLVLLALGVALAGAWPRLDAFFGLLARGLAAGNLFFAFFVPSVLLVLKKCKHAE